MAKTLNKDQIAMLDKEVQKLDKELGNKDMEKAMGMLMKKVGIKESDLDELSLSMKSITKSGLNKNVGVDKDKLKMGLKDLRKKLDKKKDEANIVRSKKGVASLRRKSYQDNPHTNKGDEKKESVNEIAVAPFVPAAIAIGRAAAPHIARGVGKVAKHVFKHKGKYGMGGAAATAGNALKKAASSNLVKKVAVGAAGAYAGKKAYDAVRNKQKEREAEKKRQDQRQNDA